MRGILLIVLMSIALPATAKSPFVLLGPADSFAIDQPTVTFELRELGDPPGEGSVVGPLVDDLGLGIGFFRALQDTGANGVLLAGFAYFDPNVLGTNPNLYGTVGQYSEQGVGGTELLDLLELYDLVFAGSDDDPSEPHVVPAVRAFGNSDLNFGSFSAIVGMPSMIDRITQWDLMPLGEAELFGFMGVSSPSAAPPVTPDSYHIDLRLVDFDPTAGRVDPDDPPPTFAPLPFVDGVRTSQNGIEVTDSAVLDSGAQLSIVSESIATGLEIDFTKLIADGGDVIEFVEVGGVGGSVQMPIVLLDQYAMPTVEGPDLIWTDVSVGVLDIPGIGGVVGMNLLTSGYAASLFGTPTPDDILGDLDILELLAELGLLDLDEDLGSQIGDLLDDVLAGAALPYIEKVILDFTLGSEMGRMRLDLNPIVNVVVPEPATAVIVCMGFLAVARRRRTVLPAARL